MARMKNFRFEEVKQSENVIEPGKEIYQQIKGNWHTQYFKNQSPIIVEVGCGRGEYTTGLAKRFPDQNFIGIDIKGDRIWKGSTVAKEEGLENVAFLRIQIDLIADFFTEGEISEFWITFPDPRPREGEEKKRLISPQFLKRYREVAKKGAIVNLKTDNTGLYEYGLEVVKALNLEVIASTNDLYASPLLDLHHGIQTTYEKRYLGEGIKIKYLKFIL